jgi:hypothetical protein
MRLHFEPSVPFGTRSTMATVSLGMTGAQVESRRRYNRGGDRPPEAGLP